MTIPIQDLPSAASPLNGAAYCIIKDGATDKKATVTQIREIDLFALSLRNQPAQGHMMLIQSSTGVAQRIRFDRIGFVKDTKMWFWMSSPPSNWTPIAGQGDAVIAVKADNPSDTWYDAGVVGSAPGTWQQEDHVLTINEIPSHNHRIRLGRDNSETGGQTRFSRRAIDEDTSSGTSNASKSYSAGGGQGHNHGDTWRPRANVGIMCEKTN